MIHNDDKSNIKASNIITEWIGTYNVFSNTSGTGMDLLLRLLREYLDVHGSDNYMFVQMSRKSERASKYLHACRVLYLDFSDFNCKTCTDARSYIAQKMSLLYKEHFDLWEWDARNARSCNAVEQCLDIIEEKADNTQLERSLRDLLYQATRTDLLRPHDSRVVLLINNIVLLEKVAMDNQYDEWMESFLDRFIVEDVYKYCETFLQIGDMASHKPELYEWAGYPERYLSYSRFGITDVDICNCKDEYPFLTDDIWKQAAFVEYPAKTDTVNWNLVIKEKRKFIEKLKENLCSENFMGVPWEQPE